MTKRKTIPETAPQRPRCRLQCPSCRFEGTKEPPARFSKLMLAQGRETTVPRNGGNVRCVLFLLEGELFIRQEQEQTELQARHGIVLCGEGPATIRAVRTATMILLAFDTPFVPAKRAAYLQTLPHDFQATTPMPAVELNAALMVVLENMRILDSPCWHLMKESELFLILVNDYPQHEVARLLLPTLHANADFKTFVMNNYTLRDSLEEIAHKANMSKSYFMRHFKEVFGISAHQWQVKQMQWELLRMIANKETNTKEMSDALGFKEPAGLYQFCRVHFGISLTRLIAHVAQNGPILP